MLSTEVTQNRGPLFSLPSQGWEAAADPMAWTTSGPACTLSTAITRNDHPAGLHLPKQTNRNEPMGEWRQGHSFQLLSRTQEAPSESTGRTTAASRKQAKRAVSWRQSQGNPSHPEPTSAPLSTQCRNRVTCGGALCSHPRQQNSWA